VENIQILRVVWCNFFIGKKCGIIVLFCYKKKGILVELSLLFSPYNVIIGTYEIMPIGLCKKLPFIAPFFSQKAGK